MLKFLTTLAFTLTLICCSQKEQNALSKTDGKSNGDTTAEPHVHPHQALHTELSQQPNQDAISQRCAKCHNDTHKGWKHSHHGQANRHLSTKLDATAFSDQSLKTSSEQWDFTKELNNFYISADSKKHQAGMAIGLTPLIQYLVSADGGRWQTPSNAWDPVKNEWFDTLEGDLRTSADWGHWSGRGMTWNSQCAWCHMTDFKKNYNLATDTYTSTWKEMGVGCTQCHGDIAATPAAKSGCLIDPVDHKKINTKLTIDNCATCHSRRAQFDENFHPGSHFGNHFGLQLPTQERLYYPDGQIKDEDYVWASLKTSNMGHKGVNCLDCHDPHTTKLKLPIKNNELCMSCHGTGTNGRIAEATIINPLTHSRHKPGSTGASCVSCHMTHTTYMGRDPRRDHGFHVPDPILTKELGIPNACSKCHKDKDIDWAIQSTEKLFGKAMHSPERVRQRARTRAIAAAYRGERQAINALLSVYSNEINPTWSASLLQIMQPWSTDQRVQTIARSAASHSESLVRAASCSILEFGSGNQVLLTTLLNDPRKEVRIAAAWATRSQPKLAPETHKEFITSLKFSADQPTGLMALSQVAADNNQLDDAEIWLKKAIKLDQTSSSTHEAYAILLSRKGKPQDALKQLEAAAKLAPENVRYTYLMALSYSELGDLDMTEKLLRDVVKKAPYHDRAHYNLGLLLASQNKLEAAILSLLYAQRANPNAVEYPYAKATLYLRQGKKQDAFEACRTALGIDRNYQPALNLIRQTVTPPKK